MGRKKDIEGQLNFLDMLVTGEVDEETLLEPVEEETQPENVIKREKMTTKVQKNTYKVGGFKECSSCWCATCEHSTVGGSVPRPLGDGMSPCPACELCIRAGKAEICVIGSADEGCRHRAEKEGLL